MKNRSILILFAILILISWLIVGCSGSENVSDNSNNLSEVEDTSSDPQKSDAAIDISFPISSSLVSFEVGNDGESILTLKTEQPLVVGPYLGKAEFSDGTIEYFTCSVDSDEPDNLLCIADPLIGEQDISFTVYRHKVSPINFSLNYEKVPVLVTNLEPIYVEIIWPGFSEEELQILELISEWLEDSPYTFPGFMQSCFDWSRNGKKPDYLDEPCAAWGICWDWLSESRTPDSLDDFCGETFPMFAEQQEEGSNTTPQITDNWIIYGETELNCTYYNDAIGSYFSVETGEGDLCYYFEETWQELSIWLTLTDFLSSAFGGGDIPSHIAEAVNDGDLNLIGTGWCNDTGEDQWNLFEFLACQELGNVGDITYEEFFLGLDSSCIENNTDFDVYELANSCIDSNNWSAFFQVETEEDLLNFFNFLINEYNTSDLIFEQESVLCATFVGQVWSCMDLSVPPPNYSSYVSAVVPDCEGEDSDSSLCESLNEEDPLNALARACGDEMGWYAEEILDYGDSLRGFKGQITQYVAMDILAAYTYGRPYVQGTAFPACEQYYNAADMLHHVRTGESVEWVFLRDLIFNPIQVTEPVTLTTPNNSSYTVFDRCELFEQEGMVLELGDIIPGTTNLTINLKIPGGIPGLEFDVPEDEKSWDYSAFVGETIAEECGTRGYPNRLFCKFELPRSYINTYQPVKLQVNECSTPIYVMDRVSIVPQASSGNTSSGGGGSSGSICVVTLPPNPICTGSCCYDEWDPVGCQWICNPYN